MVCSYLPSLLGEVAVVGGDVGGVGELVEAVPLFPGHPMQHQHQPRPGEALKRIFQPKRSNSCVF